MVAGEAAWELPESQSYEFAPRQHQYCVTVYVINEGEKIRAQLREMQPLAAVADIIVADGGSTDGSLDHPFLRSCGVRALLVKTGSGKLSAQMRMACAYAMRQGYSGVVLIDGNHKDDHSAIPEFLARLEQGFDHIQGSRFIPGGRSIRTPLSRLVGIKLLHSPLISLAAGFRYTDTTNGFRAYSRRFLLDPRVAPFRSVFSAYELHYYLAIRAGRLSFRVVEIPVTRAYPESGPVPTKISPIKGNLLVLRTLIRACLHRFNPPTQAGQTS